MYRAFCPARPESTQTPFVPVESIGTKGAAVVQPTEGIFDRISSSRHKRPCHVQVWDTSLPGSFHSNVCPPEGFAQSTETTRGRVVTCFRLTLTGKLRELGSETHLAAKVSSRFVVARETFHNFRGQDLPLLHPTKCVPLFPPIFLA